MERGRPEVSAFAEAMVQTLSLPRNAAKGHWSAMTFEQLVTKLREEQQELEEEVMRVRRYDDQGLEGLLHETVDLANVCMMLRDWALEQLIKVQSRKGGER